MSVWLRWSDSGANLDGDLENNDKVVVGADLTAISPGA